MGQYFVIANLDKREYINPREMNSGARLWEIALNRIAAVFAFLLRQSSEIGGGDIQIKFENAGRWAGDRIIVVGDGDESNLYDYIQKSPSWTEISPEIQEEFNQFTGFKEILLELRSD